MKNIRFIFVFSLLFLFIFSCISKSIKTYRNTDLHLEFDYPATFIIGNFNPERFFEDNIVLVEPAMLEDFEPISIPVGRIPIISLKVQSHEDSFYSEDDFKRFREIEEIQTSVTGNLEVFKLPGYPGPYGDQAYYYLIKLPSNDILEIYAHRFYFTLVSHSDENPYHTHYDKIIDKVIKTLKVE